MQKEVTQSINLNDPLLLGNLLGPNDENLRFIQDSFQARITVRGSQIEPISIKALSPMSNRSSARSRSFMKGSTPLKSFMMMWSFPIKDA